MLRFLIVIAICLLIASPVAWAVVRGLRTGKLPHSDSSTFVQRSKAPVRFWLLMLFFLALLAMLGWTVFRAGHQAFG
ncbi:MAG: hypothetical protein E6Q88_09085 [Lysobacteraceae bacterium]|nr:MAG: hypothetical protein E6Q88_09085 [Xanthomonadaceae bacterium]